MYLALNGAVHDAAIAAWGLKGEYDGTRPISMIRYMAEQGQSSDPALPSYSPAGLPLVPGLIELVTKDDDRGRAATRDIGRQRGSDRDQGVARQPEGPEDADQRRRVDPRRQLGAVPVRPFVTPAFQGYASGHSTFSRAAAEVLTGLTGSEYFPGGLTGYTIKAGSLKFEAGPTTDIRLEWATYYDAADQAGQSRLYGGIHVQADDFTGRRIGSQCGKEAWLLAQRYYGGQGPA